MLLLLLSSLWTKHSDILVWKVQEQLHEQAPEEPSVQWGAVSHVKCFKMITGSLLWTQPRVGTSKLPGKRKVGDIQWQNSLHTSILICQGSGVPDANLLHSLRLEVFYLLSLWEMEALKFPDLPRWDNEVFANHLGREKGYFLLSDQIQHNS